MKQKYKNYPKYIDLYILHEEPSDRPDESDETEFV